MSAPAASCMFANFDNFDNFDDNFDNFANGHGIGTSPVTQG